MTQGKEVGGKVVDLFDSTYPTVGGSSKAKGATKTKKGKLRG